MSPTISIILPFRNPGSYLEQAVKSVFAQTFSDWELLLMDDGSTDGSLEYVRLIADSRVRWFSDASARGLSHSLNQLIDVARAPYIARMDADDIMHPDRLEVQYDCLHKSDSRTVVGTGAYSIDQNSNIVGIRAVANIQRRGYTACQSFIHPTVAASTEWFRRWRYSEAPVFYRSEDAELWSRSAGESRFITIERPLLYYREVGGFSLERYVGSYLGLFLLSARYAREHRLPGTIFMAMNLAKLFTMGVADVMGVAEKLVLRRSGPLTPGERDAAERALSLATNCAMPGGLRYADPGVRCDSPAVLTAFE